MGLKKVLASLNNLKEKGVIQDYAIGGGYAVTFYDIPLATYDLDVLVILPTENDYHRLYEYFRTKGANIENVYIFIEDMPVQFLPSYISPLFHSAIEEANLVKFEGIRSRFVSVEYLVLLLLTSFRMKDKIRIQSLLNKANKEQVLSLIQKFDDERNILYERYKEVLAGT